MDRRLVGFALKETWAHRGRFGIVFTSVMIGVSMTAAMLSITGSVSQYSFMLILASIMALVASMMTIRESCMVALESSDKDYRLLSQLGASTNQVMNIILVQVGGLAVLGSAIGAVLGYRMAVLVSSITVISGINLSLSADLNPTLLTLCAVIGVVCTLLACHSPIRKATGETVRDINHDGLKKWLLLANVVIIIAGYVTATHKMVTATMILAILTVLVFYASYSSIVRWGLNTTNMVMSFVHDYPGMVAIRSMIGESSAVIRSTMTYSLCIALVSFGSVVATAQASSLSAKIDDSIHADTIMYSRTGRYFSDSQLKALKASSLVKNVTGVHLIRTTTSDGDDIRVFGVPASGFSTVFNDSGTKRAISAGRTVVGAGLMKQEGWRTGEHVTLDRLDGGKYPITVSASTSNPVFNYSVIVPVSKVDTGVTTVYAQWVDPASGNRHKLNQQVNGLLVASKKDAMQSYTKPVYENLLAFYALVSIIITLSLFGLMASCALMTIQRKKDFIVLGQLGANARQIRSVLTTKSLFSSLYGGLTGMLIGAVAGFMMVFAYSWPIGSPWFQLVWLIIASGLSGFLAAVPSAETLLRQKDV